MWGCGEGTAPGTAPGGAGGGTEAQRGFCLRVQGRARRCRGAARGLPSPGAPGRVSAVAAREAASTPPGRAAALPPQRRRAVDCGLGAAAASGAVSPDRAGPSGSAGSGAAESRERPR